MTFKWPDVASIMYTDGSATTLDKKQGSRANKIGAGVYCQAWNLSLRVAPCGQGATNTITGAELVAIWAALTKAGPSD